MVISIRPCGIDEDGSGDGGARMLGICNLAVTVVVQDDDVAFRVPEIDQPLFSAVAAPTCRGCGGA